MTQPSVSVIIPAYNAAEYIAETLDSVYSQRFTNYEMIVINDGSPDTEQLELELQRYPEKLLYLKQENRGAAAARNTGLRAASGDFLAFLDADDIWLPEFLEEQVKFIEAANADLVFSDALLVGDSSMAGRTFMQVQPSHGEVTAERLLGSTVTVLTSSVLARRKPILDAGLFDEGIKRGHDFELWLRLARRGVKFAYHKKVLGKHRIVESSLSGDAISQLKRTLAVLDAVKERGKLTESETAALNITLNRTIAQLAIERGKEKLVAKDFGGAAESFREARRLRDSWKLMASCAAIKIAPHVLRFIYQRRS